MQISWPIVAVSCALFLAGCSGAPVTVPNEANPVPGAALTGRVHGGQGPIVGAHVYLYAANTSGYGGASTSLLSSATGTKDGNGNYYVTTGSNGAFSISGDYTCPGASTQVYLYSIGGNPGVGANAAAGLMAGLGSCDTANFGSLYIVVNEVSTVATAYAIAGFATDPTHVSSSSSALAASGIASAIGATLDTKGNALGAVANLETLSTGAALATTPSGNGTAPQTLINTLANILAACINTNGAITGPASPSPCYTLFTNALSGGTMGTQPSDTATAAINIAHNPGANLDNLYGLQTPSAPFQPSLSPEPNDFTVSITYTGAGLDGSGFAPEGIAVDGSGNIWVPNYASSSVSELSPVGAPISGNSGFTATGTLINPTSIAIDKYFNAWVASYSSASMTEFNKSGVNITLPPPYYTGAGLSEPYGVAIDQSSSVWVSNFGGNSLSQFENSGVELSGSSGYANGDLVGPAGLASDTSGNIWFTNYTAATSSVGESVPNAMLGMPPTFNDFTGAGLNAPYGIAIDGSGHVWLTNRGGNGSLSELKSDGTAMSPDPAGFTGGGINVPYGLAIDGAGNVWTANNGGNSNSVSEFNSGGNAISGSNGYVSNGLIEPYGIAVDPSGNVWVASDNTSGPLTEFVGAAAPVVTPLAVGVAFNELGTRP